MPRHTGLHENRFEGSSMGNHLEREFARKWKDLQGGDTLAYILSPKNKRDDGSVSDLDEVVAATVIQWLGSNVGQCFLKSVLGSSMKDPTS